MPLPPAEGAEEITATSYIRNTWGEAWLRNMWEAGDVISALGEFAALQNNPQPTAGGAEDDGMMFTISEDGINPLDDEPTAEGAEEILASLVESLGEPDNSVTDHSYQIRPLTVEGKREWWMFHNGVGSGEPLAQWLSKFATLHAQKIADKMVEERLRGVTERCKKL
jgi:hypothetical protein